MTAPADANGQPEITHSVCCAGCYYNLRGLRVGGRCPECGLEIRAADVTAVRLWTDPRTTRRALLGLAHVQLMPVYFAATPVVSFTLGDYGYVPFGLFVAFHSLVWFRVTAPGVVPPLGRNSLLRIATRWAHVGQLLVFALLVFKPDLDPASLLTPADRKHWQVVEAALYLGIPTILGTLLLRRLAKWIEPRRGTGNWTAVATSLFVIGCAIPTLATFEAPAGPSWGNASISIFAVASITCLAMHQFELLSLRMSLDSAIHPPSPE